MGVVFIPLYAFIPYLVRAAKVLHVGIGLAATVFTYVNFAELKTVVGRHFVFPLMLHPNLALTPARGILFCFVYYGAGGLAVVVPKVTLNNPAAVPT